VIVPTHVIPATYTK